MTKAPSLTVRPRSAPIQNRRSQSALDALTAGPSFTDVALVQIADNPENPRQELGELDELAASIRELGVLQPVVLIPIAIYNAAPDSAAIAAGPGIEYVLSIGHCRTAAARLAGLTHVPAVIRSEYGGKADELMKMLAENVSRKGLTPMEEARNFGRLLASGLSMRKVESRLGAPKSHVQRRQKLLLLPEFLQAKVQAGELRLGAGESLAALEDHALMERAYALMTDPGAPERTAADAITIVKAQIEHEANAAQSLVLLERWGIRIVDPVAEWGKRAGDHNLNEHGSPKPRHLAQCLAAAIDPGDGLIDWYCIDREHLGVRDVAAESRAARRRRAAAAAERAQEYPGEPGAAYVLAAADLALLPPGPALKLALQWAMPVASLGVTEDLVNADDAKSLAFVDGLSGGDRVRFAFIAAIARQEVAARRTTWDRRQELYLRWLIAEGRYEPTSWEREQLDALAMEGEL